jgi:uncharacterized protein YhfF
MSDTATVERFWRTFCMQHGIDPGVRHDVFAFGDSPALQDGLLQVMLHGPKRATASLVLEHELAGNPLPMAGAFSVVLDGTGRPRAMIRTIAVDIRPFGQVDAAFAWDEGEDDRTLASWREEHRHCFTRDCARLGRTFSEDLPVVLERFALVWAPPPASVV